MLEFKGLKELISIVPIEYKGFVFEEPLRLDVLVDEYLPASSDASW
jgi:hypothetical protein